MNQLDKEGGLRLNAQGSDPVPEPKRKKLDVDDPNIQHVKKNQVEDGYGNLSFQEMLSTLCVKREPNSTEEDYELEIVKRLDKKLVAKGVDVKTMRDKWKDCKVMCGLCGYIDFHPEDECPYGEFIQI